MVTRMLRHQQVAASVLHISGLCRGTPHPTIRREGDDDSGDDPRTPAGSADPSCSWPSRAGTTRRESATNAARFLRSAWDGQRIASLDPEEFYHFGLQRPLVRASSREPSTARSSGRSWSSCSASRANRDVIVGVGIEPHLRWKTYCRSVLDFAKELEVGLVVTLGALLAEVPHTRPVG